MLKALTWGLPAGCALLVVGLLGTEKGRKVVRSVAKSAVKLVNMVSDEAKEALGQTQEFVAEIVDEAKKDLKDSKDDVAAAT